MNERIKELAEEVGNHADNKSGCWIRDGMWLYEYNQKFAELIIRDCAKIAAEYTEEGAEWRNGGDAIRVYFGIEE